MPFTKGNKLWNNPEAKKHWFRKGDAPWNKGKKMSLEYRERCKKAGEKYKLYFASKEELEELYCNQRLTLEKVAEVFGVCPATVFNRMKEYGIPRRERSELLRGRKRPPFPEEWRRKMSESHKGKRPAFNEEIRRKMSFYARNRTPEHRRKLSEAMKGKEPWNKGKHLSLEDRMKKSKALKGKPKSEEHRRKAIEVLKTHPKCQKPNLGRRFSKEWRDNIRKASLKRTFPNRNTSIEIKMQKQLTKKGIDWFKTHQPVLDICQADILFPEQKIAIFCDGDYWHNLPHVRKRDEKINRILTSHSWKVLRFREHEINSDVVRCVEEVRRVLDAENSGKQGVVQVLN